MLPGATDTATSMDFIQKCPHFAGQTGRFRTFEGVVREKETLAGDFLCQPYPSINGSFAFCNLAKVSIFRFKDAAESIRYFHVDPIFLRHEHQAVASDYRVRFTGRWNVIISLSASSNRSWAPFSVAEDLVRSEGVWSRQDP